MSTRRAKNPHNEPPSSSIACVSCSAAITGQYCAACGEMRVDRRHDGLGHLTLELFESFTHVDGKIFRSFRALLTRPGELTAQYLRGARKPYMTPLQVFFVANLVFFLVQTWVPWNTLTTPLSAHVNMQPYREFAREHLMHFAAQHGATLEQVQAKFDPAARVYAKSLVLSMVPLFALGSLLACWPRSRGFVAQLVAALHLYAAFLVFQSLVIGPIGIGVTRWLAGQQEHAAVDAGLSLALGVVLAAYAFGVLRRVFGFGPVSAGARALVLVGVFGAVLMAYRFLLFLVVLHTIDLGSH